MCQRGALLFASVWKDNNLEIKNWTSNSNNPQCLLGIATENEDDKTSHSRYLDELFPVHQQRLMEHAFEGRFHEYSLTWEERGNCRYYFFENTKNPLHV